MGTAWINEEVAMMIVYLRGLFIGVFWFFSASALS